MVTRDMKNVSSFQESENSMNVIIELRKSEAACFGKLRELSDELNRDFAAQTFSEIRVAYLFCASGHQLCRSREGFVSTGLFISQLPRQRGRSACEMKRRIFHQ